jgi:crotonobetainyl-CoA:carnitine CoA-transferase CaiB-like acyl-CoA transferase
MVWAGPYAGRLLGGLGAHVVKIEGPQRPDGTRGAAGGGCAGAFADLNQGKKSLVLDLARTEGREAFLELSRAVDVVLENYSPRVMPNFGLDYSALKETNSSLIMLSLPAFGSTGPWAHYVAYGSGLEFATGLATYDDEGHPCVAAVPYLDYLAGACGAVAVLAALHGRERTGQGYRIEVAQREVACQLMTGAYGGHPVSGTGVSAHRAPGEDGQSPWTDVGTAERLAADPDLGASGLFGVTASTGECHHFARLPWRIRGVDVWPETDAPAFGAHSREALCEIAGLDERQVDRLVELGVVVDASPQPRGDTIEQNRSEAGRMGLRTR